MSWAKSEGATAVHEAGHVCLAERGAVRYLRQPDRASEPTGTERRKESLTCSFSLSVPVPVPEPEAVRRIEGGDPRFWALVTVLADAV